MEEQLIEIGPIRSLGNSYRLLKTMEGLRDCMFSITMAKQTQLPTIIFKDKILFQKLMNHHFKMLLISDQPVNQNKS